MESAGAEVAYQNVEVLGRLEGFLEAVQQCCVRLIGEEGSISAHRSPLFMRCVLFKAHILMFVPDDLFHTWLLVYNASHFRTST